MRKRLVWMLPGYAVGIIPMLILRSSLHRAESLIDQLPMLCGFVSLWIAERKGKIPTGEMINRPITLLGDQVQASQPARLRTRRDNVRLLESSNWMPVFRHQGGSLRYLLPEIETASTAT